VCDYSSFELLTADIMDIFSFFMKPWLIMDLKIEASLPEDKVLWKYYLTPLLGGSCGNRKRV
jgi:hypothetical protein